MQKYWDTFSFIVSTTINNIKKCFFSFFGVIVEVTVSAFSLCWYAGWGRGLGLPRMSDKNPGHCHTNGPIHIFSVPIPIHRYRYKFQ